VRYTCCEPQDKVLSRSTAAVPKLAEGHLFGYRRCIYGAVNDSPGMIRTAMGTLFLGGSATCRSTSAQAARFLQEGEIQPSAINAVRVGVRIIAATNMPLEDKVADGRSARTFLQAQRHSAAFPRANVARDTDRKYYINHYSARFSSTTLPSPRRRSTC
jgi:transcriptional regulator with AAA-type ATPase domain